MPSSDLPTQGLSRPQIFHTPAPPKSTGVSCRPRIFGEPGGKLRVSAEQAAARSPNFPSKDGSAFAVWAEGEGHTTARSIAEWELIIAEFIARPVED